MIATLTAPPVIRSIAVVAGASLVALVAFVGAAGIRDSMPLASLAALIAGVAMLTWLRTLPLAQAAQGAPHGVRLAFLVGLALCALQLAWLAPFVIDPSRSTWGPGPTAPLPSTHACVTAYWVANDAVARTPDIYDERLSSIPQADRTKPRIPRKLGPLNIDPFEYPPTFLLLPRALASVTPDFWGFRRLWFALNLAAVIGIAIALALRLDRAAGTHAVWLTPFVIAAPPIISTFAAGNAQMAVIAVSALSLLLLERRACAIGGFLLASVIAAKLYPGVLVLYLLARRDWRAIAWTATFGITLVAVSIGVFGWAPFEAFLGEAPQLMSGEAFSAFRNPVAIANNGSVPGIVFKLALFGVPYMGYPAMRLVGWLYTLVVIGGTVWLARLRPRGGEPLVWLALLVLATMRSPFLPTYAAFPSLWLATLVAALAWRSGRAPAAVIACWCVLAIGFGPGGIPPRWGAVWSTLQTVLAFVLLAHAMRTVTARSDDSPDDALGVPAALNATAPS